MQNFDPGSGEVAKISCLLKGFAQTHVRPPLNLEVVCRSGVLPQPNRGAKLDTYARSSFTPRFKCLLGFGVVPFSHSLAEALAKGRQRVIDYGHSRKPTIGNGGDLAAARECLALGL